MALVAVVVGVSVGRVFWLVLLMVSLVVQMVGGVGDAAVVLGGRWDGRLVSSWFVRVMWLSVDGAAFGGVVEGSAGVGQECCRRCPGC